jgi:hypothetical protein
MIGTKPIPAWDALRYAAKQQAALLAPIFLMPELTST